MNETPGSPLVGIAAAYMPRLSEFGFEPGLVAAVDQHAAAVCDALVPAQRRAADSPERRSLHGEDLSDYVLGFTDWLSEVDWVEPVGHDFATLRLTAICWLIREHDLLGDSGA